MRKPPFLRFFVVFLSVLTFFCFLSPSLASAEGVPIHGRNSLHVSQVAVASQQIYPQAGPNGKVHPDTGICTYVVYAPFTATVNGQLYIIAEGGYNCNTTFVSASLTVTLNGPTMSSGAIYTHLFTCSNQSSCAGWIGYPYQSGGAWQTVVNGGSAYVGFTGQNYSTWAFL